MTFILVGASLILALMALAHVKSVEFSDPTRLLLSRLAYGFALAGQARTDAEFVEDRNWGWVIFLLILAAGQIIQIGKS
jgi:hypothetical protein